MLSAKTLSTIKSTAPLLAEHGVTVTNVFYSKLFANHPELQHIFNMSNQAKGEQSQALAASVFAYASSIDQIARLVPMVTRIAHKHASLGVLPAHYPIVGKYLLQAIQEVFSLEDNHAILQAWSEAYHYLAQIMIDTETQIYDDNASKVGGWKGFRSFVIHDIVNEAVDVKSFYLKPSDGGAVAAYQAGQYVGVLWPEPIEGYNEIRQYSLSDAHSTSHYRITVKAERANATSPAGKVSTKLHDAKIGDVVALQPPTGEFTQVADQKPVAFIAGGVGLTPLVSMLKDRIAVKGNVSDLVFIQCCRNKAHHIMADDLRLLSQQHHFKYYVVYESAEDDGNDADAIGYLNTALLGQWLQPTMNVYYCGPKPFMQAMGSMLLTIGLPQEQLHYETFGPSVA